MELKEAILEVNHWCHEKVNYQPTDIRTISPLGAIKSTYGRCGEESTFTVTAMRAAGIPARQCYTPRWAHTDDNHAWVEVWVDGKWHYLGACEPEADLDIAWFSAPALRAMLVNSNVFGKYSGPEEIIREEEKYTKVNMLSNYAPVKTVFAKVIDAGHKIVQDATVEFQLYNYAEFYPIGKKQVDKNGIASLMTGYGDLIIWAYKDDYYAYEKITVEKTDTITLQLKAQTGKEYTDIFDIVPPIEKEPKSVSEDGAAENKRRFAQEDSIREAYASTFITEEETKSFALNHQLEPILVWDFVEKSRGNYPEIIHFIEQAATINKDFTISVLEAIAPKDLRDGESEVLLSHIKHSFKYAENIPNEDKEIFIDYVLNPRIENEKLIEYKAFLQNAFGEDFIHKTKADISHLIHWMNTEITINTDANYYFVPITAKGVYELKVSDSYSRDLFFVAACRSFGIPARLEPATKVPQYFSNKWNDVNFEKVEAAIEKPEGSIRFINSKENGTDLKYRVHFALSKFENGKYNTLDYGWDTPISEMRDEITLEPGNYLLITGNRLSNGNVLTKLEYFNIKAEDKKDIIVKLRKNNQKPEVIATISFPKEIYYIEDNPVKINTKGINIIGFLEPGKEPTNHTLKDIEKIAASFDKLNADFYIVQNSAEAKLLDYNLPKKVKYVIDQDFEFLKTIKESTGKSLNNLPVFVVSKGENIYFISSGYTIGIGEQMIKVIQNL